MNENGISNRFKLEVVDYVLKSDSIINTTVKYVRSITIKMRIVKMNKECRYLCTDNAIWVPIMGSYGKAYISFI